LTLTQENFDQILLWLDPDREVAGQRYETIRVGLIRMFTFKGFNDPEDLADETINRVAGKLPQIQDCYVGNPENYFHGVARNIAREARKRRKIPTDEFPPAAFKRPEFSEEYDCLLGCLKFLDPDTRDLVLDYHVYKGEDKIAIHRILAAERRITENALRVTVHRIRSRLERCIHDCVMRRKRV
jgi:DNA-directed RNA polymerase specialized sigma24 family protein